MTYGEQDQDRERQAVRAGDADRDQAAETLRHHHQAGRLTDSELEARLEHCYRARTFGELDRLMADLPRPERERHDRRRTGWADRSPALIIGALIAAVLACGSLIGAFMHDHYGPGGHPHPPLFVPVLAAFVVWRLVVRRRRGAGWR